MFYKWSNYEVSIAYWNNIHVHYKSFLKPECSRKNVFNDTIFFDVFYLLNHTKLTCINFMLCK